MDCAFELMTYEAEAMAGEGLFVSFLGVESYVPADCIGIRNGTCCLVIPNAGNLGQQEIDFSLRSK
jgi:hypothetical protein